MRYIENYKRIIKPFDLANYKLIRRIVEFLPGHGGAWHSTGISFVHCKFPCPTLGEESSCLETTSNICCPCTPAISLAYRIGHVLQVDSCKQVGNVCEKYVWWDALLSFLRFLFYLNVAPTPGGGCCCLFRIVLPIPLFHWPTGVRAELTSPDFFMRRFGPSLSSATILILARQRTLSKTRMGSHSWNGWTQASWYFPGSKLRGVKIFAYNSNPNPSVFSCS